MALYHVDREKLFDEVLAIRDTWHPAGDSDGEFVWDEVSRHIKRARALMPDDPDLADGVSSCTVRDLQSLLSEIEVYRDAGRIDFPPDRRQAAILRRLLADLAPERSQEELDELFPDPVEVAASVTKPAAETPAIVRLLNATDDGTLQREAAIVNDPDRTGEQKMIELLRLDRRKVAWTSQQWSEVLAVSAPAVRGYGTWKALQRAKKADD